MVGMDKISSSKMKSLMKFNIFWFYWTILHKTIQSTKWQAIWSLIFLFYVEHENMNLGILHTTMQSTKWQATWSLRFFVLCLEHQNMKSCDSTQNHAQHKMTSHMKFDVFCLMYRTSKHENLAIIHKTTQSTKWQAPWSSMGEYRMGICGCITMSLVSTLKGKANENDTY
jgi:hypothetical protein